MGLGHYLFGFSGRINRAKQWAVLLVGLAIAILFGVLFGFTIGSAPLVAIAQHKSTIAALIASPQAHTFAVGAGLLYLLAFYVNLAVATKRLHDRNKSAWWLLLFFALPLILDIPAFRFMPMQFAYVADVMRTVREHLPPPPQLAEPPAVIIGRGAATIIGLWAFVELYCLRGTVGDNRFGPDPLAGRD
ncbi:MAG TPA: DUF805 domain-containing protein [Rhizomicrobium sp.]|nr:DUF805 domain-containing protein [Rhizomicrobium sp.]